MTQTPLDPLDIQIELVDVFEESVELVEVFEEPIELVDVVEVGADGASAYEIALANGFVGTEAEWLASLAGTQIVVGPTPPTNTNNFWLDTG